ncbi:MAG: hypothetical protein ACPLPR_07945 [Bacillota bacterium]
MRLGVLWGVALSVSPVWIVVALACVILGWMWQLVMVLLVLAAHELAHMVVALGYGLRVESIEVTPLGGVMCIPAPIELEPIVELCVALAGPVNNMVLLSIGSLLKRMELASGQSLAFFQSLNAYMAFVNLLPALPLDGGRACRAYLASKYGYRRGTLLMLSITRIVVVLSGVSSVFLLFWHGGVGLAPLGLSAVLLSQSRAQRISLGVVIVEALVGKKKLLASKGMLPVEQVLVLESVSLSTIAQRLQPGRYHMIDVCDAEMRLKGTVSEREVVKALLSGQGNLTIGELILPPTQDPVQTRFDHRR